MIAIETRGLTRRFGKLTAVDHLELKIPAGGLFGLIGPNGAGKTTTLRMLAGLLEPSQGEILIYGKKANHDWRDLQRQIGFMPDFFGVYEDLLVWEYLDFFARCYGLPADQRARVTDELLELVDLYEKRDNYVQTLSRGMRQRLCLAHALVHDPQVLLLDEPASGLDPRARVEMRELLKELKAMGKTIVLSSHILAELAELCDSVGIIEKGQLVASGSLDHIRRQAHQGKVLRVKVLSNPVQAETFLLAQPGVSQVYPIDQPPVEAAMEGPEADEPLQMAANGSLLEVEFQGDDAATADLLEAMIANNLRVASLSEVGTDLEEIFLRLTRGEVA